jgi:phosphatidylglycerophosphate synthase
MGGEWHWPVSLWLPNLCTYVRIAACGNAFAVAFTDKKLFTVLWLFCFICNELSRYISRLMNLSSTLGDVLVHVSSRISTTGLLLILSHLFRRDYRVLLLLLELDIASHWLRIYCEVMSKKSHCQHLEKYQNFLYVHPLFRLFCALSQEVMYISLYLLSFELLEQSRPAKLDMQRLKHSKYWKIIVVVAPGYIMRLIANLDEIRLATSLCLHFDNQPTCLDKVKVVVAEPSHVVLEPCPLPPRRRRKRTRSLARNRSRSRCKFDPDEDIVADF